MSSFFADPATYPHNRENLFLGLSQSTGKEVGIALERHALTIAGSGAGKGATLLIPNAAEWRHNLLVVDPKGEVASAVWGEREVRGQSVHVLDPFKAADVPDHVRATFNPLAAIDPEGITAREDIEAIADGLVTRSDPKHEEWYAGAVSLLAGLIAFAIETAPPALRSFTGVRTLLLQPNDALYATAQAMTESTAFGGLAREAGIILMTACESEKGMEKDFLGAARRYTKWLDSTPIAECLASSSFDLADLKSSPMSVFLVLPPQYLQTHAAFLRLFVRTAMEAMMRDGAKVNRRCLFMLDEFASLGRLDAVSKGMGLMRGYGLHLWPFLQDLGQLQSLYGREVAETFFGNADAAIFFGNTDPLTLRYVSQRIGAFRPDEVQDAPPRKRTYAGWRDGWRGGADKGRERLAVAHDNAKLAYDHAMRVAGRPRLAPDEVARVVGKRAGDKVARSAIVFAAGGEVLNLALDPYFDHELPYEQSVRARVWMNKVQESSDRWMRFWSSKHMFWFWPLLAIALFWWTGRGFPPLSLLAVACAFAIPSTLIARLLVAPLFRAFDTFWHRLWNNRV